MKAARSDPACERCRISFESDTVALYQALGGGWWNRVDETPASEAKPAGIAGIFVPAGALPAAPHTPIN